MEYRVKRTDDELYHWLKKGQQKANHKYIKREWKNGRWVYYYADDLKKEQESKREQQNKLYDTASKVADTTYKATVSSIKTQRITKDNLVSELSKHRKLIDAGKTYIATKVASKTLKALNNIGDGTLDDKIVGVVTKVSSAISKGRKFLRDLFG